MSDAARDESQIPGLRSAAANSGGTGPVARLVRAVTPDLRPDPRAALRDMRIKGKLRADLEQVARRTDAWVEDETADDPYADADGQLLKRNFSVFKTRTDEVVLLQIGDWIANDGANVG